MIESLGKLRDFAVANLCGKPGLALLDLADEIEREIEANYMELPKDADGVPIRVGDKLRGVYETFEVCAVSEHYAYWEQGRHWDRANECHHVKPRTIEDVLNEYYDQRGWDEADNCAMEAETLTAKYADEIRELLEVDDD